MSKEIHAKRPKTSIEFVHRCVRLGKFNLCLTHLFTLQKQKWGQNKRAKTWPKQGQNRAKRVQNGAKTGLKRGKTGPPLT